jgi:hypothetical protein
MSEPFTNEDFNIQGDKLRLARRGAVAVLIMSKSVPEHIQLLKVLSSINLNHLETGFLDISSGKNREVVVQAKQTTTQINQLPYLAFFYDQKLKARYKGDIHKGKMEHWFQEKIMECAQANVSSDRKNMTSAPNQRFAMAQQQMPVTVGGGTKKQTDGIGQSSVVGINVAWRADLQK